MENKVIGYIFCDRGLGKDEEAFLDAAKKKNMELVMFNIAKEIEEKQLEEKAKKCHIFLNNSAEEFAWEIVKTIEEFGKKVVDSSDTYKYTEDKWMFYLRGKEAGIPMPETILLSENLNTVKKELNEFGRWPVVLKRVWGTMGEFVDRAENADEAVRTINKFWKKGNEKLPIIAQEFIESPCYRVTTVGSKIVQTALKENKGWKSTGVYEKKFKKFPVDSELRKIVKNAVKAVDIKIAGIDLLKKDGKWIVLEINAIPAFDFFENERKMIVSEVLDFLKKA